MEWNQYYAEDNWAKELGIEILDSSSDNNVLSLPFISRNLQADGGVIHGGIIGSLLHDCGFSLAAQAVGEAACKTLRCLDFQVNYLKAAKDCDLRASAKIIRQSRKFLFVQADDASGG